MSNSVIEEWEKDFSGLEALQTIHVSDVPKYKKAALEVSMKIEFKKITVDEFEVWTPTGRDLTEFWLELEDNGGF